MCPAEFSGIIQQHIAILFVTELFILLFFIHQSLGQKKTSAICRGFIVYLILNYAIVVPAEFSDIIQHILQTFDFIFLTFNNANI